MATAKYRAKEPLFIDWVRAHNEGDVVDAERVERFGWADKVEKVSDGGRGKKADDSKAS